MLGWLRMWVDGIEHDFPHFDLLLLNKNKQILSRKNGKIFEKNMFLTIFVKKSGFFRAKKKLYGNFFVEITKKGKK